MGRTGVGADGDPNPAVVMVLLATVRALARREPVESGISFRQEHPQWLPGTGFSAHGGEGGSGSCSMGSSSFVMRTKRTLETSAGVKRS